MATVIYCDDFMEQLGEAVHDFTTHTFKLALTNTAITTAMVNKAGITGEIAYTNLGGGNPTVTVSQTETGGTATITGDAVTITATDTAPTFRYYALYNDTATGDPIVMSWDHGSSVTLATGESFKVSFNNDDTAGTILTIAKP